MAICVPAGTDWSCYGTPAEIAAIDPVLKERAEGMAWLWLQALSGYRIGACPITVRPCLARCGDASGSGWLTAPVGGGSFAGVWPGTAGLRPFIGAGGQWLNGCGCNPTDCSCTSLCEAILPGPVGGVTEVWLDGAVLPASAYRIDNGTRLVRTDGACWPSCQDMTQDAHGDDAFSVTYYQCAAPDQLSKWAAGILSAEILKACTDDAGCRLPANTTSVARQGISIELDQFNPARSTGLPEVDILIAIYNPNHLSGPPVVSSPDLRRPRVQTWGS